MARTNETTPREVPGQDGSSIADPAEKDALAALEAGLEAALRLSPAAVLSLARAACRYCWGKGHLYQWTTRREYGEALETALHDGRPRPRAEGGFGYRRDRAPNPACPECCGMGEDLIRLRDLETADPNARHWIKGLKPGPRGPELVLRAPAELLQARAAVRAARQANKPADPDAGFAPVAIVPRTELVDVKETPLDPNRDMGEPRDD